MKDCRWAFVKLFYFAFLLRVGGAVELGRGQQTERISGVIIFRFYLSNFIFCGIFFPSWLFLLWVDLFWIVFLNLVGFSAFD